MNYIFLYNKLGRSIAFRFKIRKFQGFLNYKDCISLFDNSFGFSFHDWNIFFPRYSGVLGHYAFGALCTLLNKGKRCEVATTCSFLAVHINLLLIYCVSSYKRKRFYLYRVNYEVCMHHQDSKLQQLAQLPFFSFSFFLLLVCYTAIYVPLGAFTPIQAAPHGYSCFNFSFHSCHKLFNYKDSISLLNSCLNFSFHSCHRLFISLSLNTVWTIYEMLTAFVLDWALKKKTLGF